MKINTKSIAYLAITFLILLVAGGTATAATLYVDHSGLNYTSIQAAVNAANWGDTIIVKPETYVENVNVNKGISIVSDSGNPEDTIVKAANPNNNVFVVTASQVTIKGLGIEGATGGWCNGILLEGYVSSSVIENNKLKDNWGGIHLYTSNNNQVINNSVSNGTHGIYLEDSKYNTLKNNTMYSNLMNFRIDSLSGSQCYYNDIDISNLVEGKPLYYIKDTSGLTINPSYNPGAIYLINCSNVLVRDLKLNSSCSYGLFLYSTNNSVVEHLTVSNNYAGGIYVQSSSNDRINNNSISIFGCGIYLSDSTNNIVSNNTAVHNSQGICLSGSSNNNLYGNVADLNTYDGIYLRTSIYGSYPSIGNVIKQNLIRSNNNAGIEISSNCKNNLIFNNYFNNTNNAWASDTNTWNITKTPGTNIVGGPYIGGNYWGSPSGTGFSQTHSDADGDGICDEIYTLYTGNIDYLPLAENTHIPPRSIPEFPSIALPVATILGLVALISRRKKWNI